MAFRKLAQSIAEPAITEIDESAFGEYTAENFEVKQYKSVYYAIRNLQGFSVRRKLAEDFIWEEYKAKFSAVFGTPEEQKYTLDQLVAYAMKKFNKGLDELIAFNRESWNRWNARESVYAEEFSDSAIARVNEVLANVAATETSATIETLATNVDEIPY